jgi:hypothetical protein
MMLRIAWRSLVTRPIRTAVLAFGFGFGIAVMAVLLGVGQAMLEQAHAPALQGGGDVVVSGFFGSVPNARFVLTSVIGAPDLKQQITAASPSKTARLFLMTDKGAVPINARGGIPSLEKAIGDREVAGVRAWTDASGDRAWSQADGADVLRAMDRFHPVPPLNDEADRSASWAEWLYFNGRSTDGRVRLYLTFLVGPEVSTGRRAAGVRLQLEREGRSKNYEARGHVEAASVLAHAPDLDIAGNRVRLDGHAYRITLALENVQDHERVSGDLVLDAAPGRSLPPASIRGANGWMTGYVVPALSGNLSASLMFAHPTRPALSLSGVGYHDHNWGFWQGVSWQWGQVAHDDISIVYGRVFPPADVADPARVPGFLTVLGPGGPLGFSTDVAIDDRETGRVIVRAHGRAIDLELSLNVEDTVKTAMAMTQAPGASPLNFLQLGGPFHVTGRVGDRTIDFTARGAAETFKP